MRARHGLEIHANRSLPRAAHLCTQPGGSDVKKGDGTGSVPQSPTLLVMRFSAARTTPSFARMPTQEPALEIASMAYLPGVEQAGGSRR